MCIMLILIKNKVLNTYKNEKILVIHNKYQETGGEDISVMEEIKFLNKNFIVEELIFSNKIDNFFLKFFIF